MSAINLTIDQEMDLMEGKMDELLEKQKKLSFLINKNLNERKNISLIADLIDRLEELMKEEMRISKQFHQLNGSEEEFNKEFINREAVLDAFRKRMGEFLDYLEAHEEELEKEMTLSGCYCSCSRPCNCA